MALHLFHWDPLTSIKALVRHKKPGSTQNALPSMHQLSLPLSNTPPSLWEIFFPILFKYFVSMKPMEKWKWNHIDIQIYLISLWNMKCNYSFLFVMITMSAAINKCYLYDSMILGFLFWLLHQTINFVDKSVSDNSLHRLDHCDVIASCSEFRCAAQRSWTPNCV